MPPGRKKKAVAPKSVPGTPPTTSTAPPPIISANNDSQPTNDDDEEDEFIKKIKAAKAAKQSVAVASSVQKFIPIILEEEKATKTNNEDAFFAHAKEILSRKPVLVDAKERERGGKRRNGGTVTIEDDGEELRSQVTGSAETVNGHSGIGEDVEEVGTCRPAQAEDQEIVSDTSIESSEDDDIRTIYQERAPAPQCMDSTENDAVVLLDDEPETLQSAISRAIDDEITIRVKVDGKLEKFTLLKDEKLETIFKALAQSLRVSINEFSLNWNTFEQLRPSDTPRSLELNGIAILECVRNMNDAKSSNSSCIQKRKAGDGNSVTLKFQTGDRKCVVEMVVSKMDSFDIIKSMYIKERSLSVDIGKIKFVFDGESVSNTDTPADLDMDDGDCIDVVM